MVYIKPNGFGRLIDPRYTAVSRMVGYTLTLLDEPAMWQLAAVIYKRLEPRERVFLARASLWGLEEEEYTEVVQFMERTSETATFLDTPAGRAALIEWREQRDARLRRRA